ncbi:MAG: glycosyl hydrolase 115 family protein [Candidatus Marinimicrobia bacterium]|nr:glycosyl hydrolase 115 family protein [Candidatus Neomarinimicrobiota bacterium]
MILKIFEKKVIGKNLTGLTIFILLGTLFFLVSCNSEKVVLNPGFQIFINDTSSVPIQKSLAILQRDIKQVLGKEAVISTDFSSIDTIENALIIINGGSDAMGLDILTGFERHHLFTKQQNLVLQGSDVRGTIFAMMTFSEKVLDIPPLWFWASITLEKKGSLEIPCKCTYDSGEPYVKYRAWFPNDTDMFKPWLRDSQFNREIWLETMLRLKMNTVEIESASDYSESYAISDYAKLIDNMGLKITFHHQSAMDSKFNKWNDYWRKIKNTEPPELLLANKEKFEEFWRYNVRCLAKNGIDPIWGINFRGNRDIPFWYTFTDAPEDMDERAEIINQMVQKQVDILKEETGQENPVARWIFYDEMSDFLAENKLKIPSGKYLIWNFVAARRDHFPNDDIRNLTIPENTKLGYYMNLQFTSTGSHFVAVEGPWKMEKNFRYIDSKNNHPIYFSVVNAGNIREHLLSLSANAALLWDFEKYDTDKFLTEYCASYFGDDSSEEIAELYRDYFYSFWNQKKNDLKDYERQYNFHDLRYKQVVKQLSQKFFGPIDLNPLEDYSWEQLPGRTFRIVPEDCDADNQIDAIINGTSASMAAFKTVAQRADSIYDHLDIHAKVFFNNNLRIPAHFMMHLNETVNKYCMAYRKKVPNERDDYDQQVYLKQALQAAKTAQHTIYKSAYGPFKNWYAEERIFDINDFVIRIEETYKTALEYSGQVNGVNNKAME